MRWPLCNKEKSETHMLLKFNGTYIWQEQIWNDKWQHINKATVHTKIINSTKIWELKNQGKFLYKSKSKCKNQMEEVVQILNAVTRNYHKQKCFCVN